MRNYELIPYKYIGMNLNLIETIVSPGITTIRNFIFLKA